MYIRCVSRFSSQHWLAHLIDWGPHDFFFGFWLDESRARGSVGRIHPKVGVKKFRFPWVVTNIVPSKGPAVVAT